MLKQKRAKNGTVPRAFDPGFKSSYQKLRAKLDRPAVTVDISGPQGAGKTTLAGLVEWAARFAGLRVVVWEEDNRLEPAGWEAAQVRIRVRLAP